MTAAGTDRTAVARVAVAPGARLAVRRWAGADRPPFLLVHGLASSARMWDGVASRLAAAGHPVAAVDLRGHGVSDAPGTGYDQATAVADLLAVAAALEWERPLVVGQSWGGNVVVALAAAHPERVRGVAAVDGGVIDLRRRFPDWEDCAAALAPPDLSALPYATFEARVRAAHPDWPETGIQGTLGTVARDPSGRVRARLARVHHMAILHDLWAHPPAATFAGIHVPVLFMPSTRSTAGGVDDPGLVVDAAVVALPRGRATWVVGHHDVHAEQPDVVAGVLLDAVADGFLTGTAP